MPVSLDDLSTATLDCLADLIEQRLADPASSLAPAPWQDEAARDDARDELSAAGRAWTKSSATLAAPKPAAAPRLH